MVYVIDKSGNPLMPMERHGKVRRLLRDGKAVVYKRCPFTIKLLYDTGNEVQQLILGVDAGNKHVGLSVTSEDREYYAEECTLRSDITELISTRREMRHTRRNRKTRYRKPRFDNRRRSEGWLAPSIEQKIGCHIKLVERICKILPISEIVIETASFDIQKIKNPSVNGKEYQQGDQLGFWNVREYVLFRDGHECQCCHGKSKDKILNVHHIESRKTGGNSPGNLITLCETCHEKYHKGLIQLPKNIKRGMSFRDAAFMGIMRWTFYNRLKDQCEKIGIPVKMTFGYITKNIRIKNDLLKSHIVDARCISGHPVAKASEDVFYSRKVRCHNRQIHKMKISKNGIRKKNQAPYLVKGFRLFDKVKYKGLECFIFARRSSGYFDLRMLDGKRISASANVKDICLIDLCQSYLIERRKAVSLS